MSHVLKPDDQAQLDLAVQLAPKVAQLTANVASRNIGRETVVRATLLSLVTGYPAFFLGPPGVAKTRTVQDLSRQVMGMSFYDALMTTVSSPDQILVEDTEIEEIIGPDGRKTVRVREKLGLAATSHLFFADEIWKAEPRVLQALLDLSNGQFMRWRGAVTPIPLLAMVAASNELPDTEGNLGAAWSRMTIRADVRPLDRAGKATLLKMIAAPYGAAIPTPALTLEEVVLLHDARPFVGVSDKIQKTILDFVETLLQDSKEDWEWLWADDRRMGRVIDVLQASALLAGRTEVGKQDLRVLEYVLWDTPEQIPLVRAKLAPLVRTPLSDAQEQMEALQAPGGPYADTVERGGTAKLSQGLAQLQELEVTLERLESEADVVEKPQIATLREQFEEIKQDFIARATGVKRRN